MHQVDVERAILVRARKRAFEEINRLLHLLCVLYGGLPESKRSISRDVCITETLKILTRTGVHWDELGLEAHGHQLCTELGKHLVSSNPNPNTPFVNTMRRVLLQRHLEEVHTEEEAKDKL
jgi:hypothetical protein